VLIGPRTTSRHTHNETGVQRVKSGSVGRAGVRLGQPPRCDGPGRGHRPERLHHQTHRRTEQPQEHPYHPPLRPATPLRRSTPERLPGSSPTSGLAADSESVSMPNPVNVKVGEGREISAGRARLISVDGDGRIDPAHRA